MKRTIKISTMSGYLTFMKLHELLENNGENLEPCGDHGSCTSFFFMRVYKSVDHLFKGWTPPKKRSKIFDNYILMGNELTDVKESTSLQQKTVH